MAMTRFGKTMTTGLAVLTRACLYPERWAIVAPRGRQAAKMMREVIDHSFDNALTLNALQLDRGETLDRLRKERSKSKLTFKVGDLKSEVFILTADSRNKTSQGEGVMGEGASNLVLEEASLISDEIESKIFRMLGDSMNNFYMKIGNPFYRNHFYQSSIDPKWHHLNFDYRIGLAEGRLTDAFVREAQGKPNFDILYENRFPESDLMDAKGYTQLVNDAEYNRALQLVKTPFGIPVMGVDVARGGGCYNVWVIRYKNVAFIAGKTPHGNLMDVAGKTIEMAKKYHIHPTNTFVDAVGVGGGVVDALNKERFFCRAVVNSEKADDTTLFYNKRAQNFWRMKEWLSNGGVLDKEHDWHEILYMKYKVDTASRIQMISKLELQKGGIASPDTPDALAMTFDAAPYVELGQEEKDIKLF